MTWTWKQPDWPNWRFDLKELEDLERKFLLGAGRLLGAWSHITSKARKDVQVEILSDEAIKTSEIEGEYLNRDSVRSSVRREFGLNAHKGANPGEAGIAELMVSVFRGFDQKLTHQTLFKWHEMVCRAQKNIDVIGAYRRHTEAMQIISGPDYRQEVHFEAPPSSLVPEEMTIFLAWLESSQLPILATAGLAHLHFVTIHPFEDGNGRIARAISEKCISQGLGQPSLHSLARQIEKDRSSYFSELKATNKSLDIQSWLIWFAETVLSAQTYSLKLIDHIIAKTRMLEQLHKQLNARQVRALTRMFDAGPEGLLGGLSAKNYISITGATTPTTTRDLNDLVKKGALIKTGERKGTQYWLNTQA